MEADESLLHLFDYFWFENQIFKKNSMSPVVSSKLEDDDKPKLARISTSHEDDKSIITSSQESLNSGGSDNLLSPNSVLTRSPMKLKPIFSGKGSDEVPKVDTKRKRRGKGLRTKSLSELEFEELKGFMDLGFVFSEEDKNSSLVEIIPGLQRFGKEEEDKIINSVAASSRQPPYLSQAWENMEYGRKSPEKLKLEINAAAVGNEMDMKHQLRFWAHSVASVVKFEDFVHF